LLTSLLAGAPNCFLPLAIRSAQNAATCSGVIPPPRAHSGRGASSPRSQILPIDHITSRSPIASAAAGAGLLLAEAARLLGQ